MDYKQHKPFKNWKNNPTNNDDGSINYADCDKEDMALMIAWEKLLKYNMKHELAEEKKKVKHNNAAHDGHVNTTGAETLVSELQTAIIKLRSAGHKGTAAAPPQAAKPRKPRKLNPSYLQQQEEYQVREDKNKAAADRKGKEYKPGPSLVLREPGTYGPKEQKTP